MNCLIGYSGFVGSNILLNNKIHFDELFNRKNINDIKSEYDTIVFTALPGTTWYANKYPEEDKKNVEFFIEKLKNIKCRKFILISTICVYPNYNNKSDESEILCAENCSDSYGRHRLMFEQFVTENFSDVHIIRLPTVYGKNLKKGVLFDLLNDNNIENICLDDEHQFYDLSHINEHINYSIENNLKVFNLFSEPIQVRSIIQTCFEDCLFTDSNVINYKNRIIQLINRPPKKYDICTKFYKSGYIYDKANSLHNISSFLKGPLSKQAGLYIH
jgi:nucleoside-diphosphate-sugar epimerase